MSAGAGIDEVGPLHVPRRGQGQIVSYGYRAQRLPKRGWGVFSVGYDSGDQTWSLPRRVGRRVYPSLAAANAAAADEAL